MSPTYAIDDAGTKIPDSGVGGPKFDGTGMFTVDGSMTASNFFGVLAGGKFKSNQPATTKVPVNITINVSLISGAPPLGLIVQGAEFEFTTGTDMASGKPGLLDGRIHGAIKNADVQNTIIPAVAALLTGRICPTGFDAMGACKACDLTGSNGQIAGIFDTGMCGTAKAMDCKIDTCEVAQNSIIMAVLAPDVQLFDANGAWAPSKANTMKDSLSLGLAFTAVQAVFTP